MPFLGIVLTLALTSSSSLLAQSEASNGELATRIKNCVDLKNGNARLIPLDGRCFLGERLVKIAIPKVKMSQPPVLLSGISAPIDSKTGKDGDFYIDTTSQTFYGPRVDGIWGVGVILKGTKGETGLTGLRGEIGLTGAKGETGTVGASGPAGASGAAGPAGAKGETGTVGAKGETGTAGSIGPIGLTGPAGGFGDYGSFYDTSTVTLVINTATPVPLNTTALSRGISIVNGARITFTTSGNYNLSFSLQINKLDSGTDTVSIWLCRGVTGGVCTNVPWTNTNLPLIGNDVRAVTAWNFFIDAEPGDYYQLMISSSGSTLQTQIISGPATTNPVRPQVPSSIVTVSQIG